MECYGGAQLIMEHTVPYCTVFANLGALNTPTASKKLADASGPLPVLKYSSTLEVLSASAKGEKASPRLFNV